MHFTLQKGIHDRGEFKGMDHEVYCELHGKRAGGLWVNRPGKGNGAAHCCVCLINQFKAHPQNAQRVADASYVFSSPYARKQMPLMPREQCMLLREYMARVLQRRGVARTPEALKKFMNKVKQGCWRHTCADIFSDMQTGMFPGLTEQVVCDWMRWKTIAMFAYYRDKNRRSPADIVTLYMRIVGSDIIHQAVVNAGLGAENFYERICNLGWKDRNTAFITDADLRKVGMMEGDRRAFLHALDTIRPRIAAQATAAAAVAGGITREFLLGLPSAELVWDKYAYDLMRRQNQRPPA